MSQNLLISKGLGRGSRELEIFQLSLKMIFTQIAPLAVSFIIARFVSQQGEIEFATYSLVFIVYVTVLVTGTSILQSLYFIAGKEIGVGDDEKYRRAIKSGFLVATLLSIFSILLMFNVNEIFKLFQVDNMLTNKSISLGMAAAVCIFPALLFVVIRVHTALSGKAGLALIISWVTSVVSIFVMYFFSNYLMELKSKAGGLAFYSMAIGHWLMVIVGIIFIQRVAPLSLKLVEKSTKYLIETSRAILSVGWPIGAVVFLDNFTLSFSSLLIGREWPVEVVAHSASILWVSIGLVVPLGISQAAVQHTAILNSSGDFEKRNRAAWFSLMLALCCSLIVAVNCFIFPVEIGQAILSSSNDSASTIEGLKKYVPMAGILFISQSVIVVCAAILRGIGITKAPLLQAFIGYGVVACGLQFVIGYWFEKGPLGIWYGINIGFALTAIIMSIHCAKSLELFKSWVFVERSKIIS